MSTQSLERTADRRAGVERAPLWYKDAIIYELHVRAFFDSSGDGMGDFRGLAEKLLAEVNRQLDAKGLILRRGTLIDATILEAAVRPPGRFGELTADGGRVRAFNEKSQAGGGLINGGFLVLDRGGVAEGDPVRVESRRGAIIVPARVTKLVKYSTSRLSTFHTNACSTKNLRPVFDRRTPR